MKIGLLALHIVQWLLVLGELVIFLGLLLFDIKISYTKCIVGLLLYPLFLVVFWYRDFFPGSVRISSQILVYSAELLSVPLLFKTFFKPLKNEYREGLVWFSIILGIFLKTILLAISLAILSLVIIILIFFNLTVIVLPAIIVWFIFTG